MDMKALEQELRQNGAMRSTAESPEAKRLLRSLDAAGIQRAANRGDTEALKGYLAQALSTPEGKALAEKVRKAVKSHG